MVPNTSEKLGPSLSDLDRMEKDMNPTSNNDSKRTTRRRSPPDYKSVNCNYPNLRKKRHFKSTMNRHEDGTPSNL